MTKQNKIVLNSNIDFIQLKLCDFSDEEIDQEKIISERLNKTPNLENTTLLNMIIQFVQFVEAIK